MKPDGLAPGRRARHDAHTVREDTLVVHEIYRSIQGESTFAGLPCVFVRLTACSARCTWCDTPHAFREGTAWPLADMLARALAFDCPLVELTGGEPLLQADVYLLMQRLLDEGHTVMLETGGHRSVEQVPAGVISVIDVKCPGSGEADRNHWPNLDRLRPTDEVKFVIKDRTDYEYARGVVTAHRLFDRCAAVLFSPVHGVLAPKMLAEWILADRLPVRLQLQAHKYVWGADVRGV